MKFEIELNEAESKALAYIAEDPIFFLQNLINEQCRLAIELIVNEEVKRMLSDPSINEIPADKEKIVLEANIQTAAERYASAPHLNSDLEIE